MYTPPTYLVRSPLREDGYIEVTGRAEAYRTVAHMPACDECKRHLGASGTDRATFEHHSGTVLAIHLTIACLDCAPVMWARLLATRGERAAAA